MLFDLMISGKQYDFHYFQIYIELIVLFVYKYLDMVSIHLIDVHDHQSNSFYNEFFSNHHQFLRNNKILNTPAINIIVDIIIIVSNIPLYIIFDFRRFNLV
ncbi:hypothetical protein DERP_014410 [Dermatophagoides pteronyssinus]|uniref:Uncharacterized protein n=1 Tax=Dermatophagoides pteronyssinus TaxID=6956 RepID=A0ABQ8J5X3_DERPT|nr:hypothetical protein DERP_014410 [Dermatophagoides pteronyssinus]